MRQGMYPFPGTGGARPGTPVLAIDNLVQSQGTTTGQGLVYTYQFTAPDNTFTFRLADNPGDDGNAILGGLTLEVVPKPSALTLLAVGAMAVAGRRRGPGRRQCPRGAGRARHPPLYRNVQSGPFWKSGLSVVARRYCTWPSTNSTLAQPSCLRSCQYIDWNGTHPRK